MLAGKRISKKIDYDKLKSLIGMDFITDPLPTTGDLVSVPVEAEPAEPIASTSADLPQQKAQR